MESYIHKNRKKEKNFTILDNKQVQRSDLSFKATGLYCYLMSLPDDWNIYISDLKNRKTDGKSSVSSGIEELIKKGYMYKFRLRDENGRLRGWRYEFFEDPEDNPNFPKNAETLDIKGFSPKTDFPTSVFPISENQSLQNKQKTNKTNNKNNIAKHELEFLTPQSGCNMASDEAMAAYAAKGKTEILIGDEKISFKDIFESLQPCLKDMKATEKRLILKLLFEQARSACESHIKGLLNNPNMLIYKEPLTLESPVLLILYQSLKCKEKEKAVLPNSPSYKRKSLVKVILWFIKEYHKIPDSQEILILHEILTDKTITPKIICDAFKNTNLGQSRANFKHDLLISIKEIKQINIQTYGRKQLSERNTQKRSQTILSDFSEDELLYKQLLEKKKG
ncbi:helix-turn-helix domain-containing protein [Tuberibacillus calidus]|jgi:hypothetical protein|uniref:helix-turn-helix domain-containing protein n=1 Tax=Tuberibacillus calidus TaxID=340097 RepID=UPI00041EB432|nr:helix-turn-helix domain-containing protein [Tuberibacillus calidus]